MNGAL